MRHLPTLAAAKAMARALRAGPGGQGLSHSAALERVARAHGFADWNGCRAAIAGIAPAPGDRVAGRYLGQWFRGRIRRAQAEGQGWTRITVDFDHPVDVVRFAAFSNLRRRVSASIGPAGHSRERTSDGQPQLVLCPEGGHSEIALQTARDGLKRRA